MHICVGDVGVDLKMEMKTIVFYLFMSCLSLYFDKSELIESQTKLSRIKWVYSSNFWSEISDLENFEEGAETIKDEETVVGGKRCLSCFVNNRLCYAIWQKKKRRTCRQPALAVATDGEEERGRREGQKKEERSLAELVLVMHTQAASFRCWASAVVLLLPLGRRRQLL